jgi:hypothetical protein
MMDSRMRKVGHLRVEHKVRKVRRCCRDSVNMSRDCGAAVGLAKRRRRGWKEHRRRRRGCCRVLGDGGIWEAVR